VYEDFKADIKLEGSVFTTNFDRGDFRIIDGEKIWPRVRRPPVGSV
jgi:hypothetical protein